MGAVVQSYRMGDQKVKKTRTNEFEEQETVSSQVYSYLRCLPSASMALRVQVDEEGRTT